jgi:L-rhamnose 1-dehydrogenase
MITNKIILITGGSSGIGNATVKLFLKNKNKVIVIDKNPIKEKDINLYFYKSDLSKIKSIQSILKKILNKFVKIDILVLNAAICPMKEFLKIDEIIFDKVVNTNQKGAFFLAQQVSKIMIKKKTKGKIVFLSSVSSIFGGSLQAHYCATKGAINQIMKSMAISLGKYNINVNAILPGTVITNLNKKQLSRDLKLKKYFIKRTPLNRLVLPEEIASSIFFLSSDMASGINGECLVVDGGMSINFQ